MSTVSNKESIPPEIVEQGPSAVEQYLQQINAAEVDYLNEAKLIIVGDGGVGKTSLVRRILGDTFVADETTTRGIDISPWKFVQENGRFLRVNIWDFGGQEIYYATHQFFLSKNSLYIVVVDSRRYNVGSEYWLNSIDLFGQGSPVLIVKNKTGQGNFEINERGLRAQFSNIKEILSISLLTDQGVSELIDHIKHYIGQLPHIGNMIPKSWVRIRKALENVNRDYIALDEYYQICEKYGVDKTSDKLSLSEYLHDIGIFFHLQNNLLLKNIIILYPLWITNAIHQILDNRHIQDSQGRFTRNDLVKFLSQDNYAQGHDYLLELMLAFQLCYPLDKDQYLVPQFLSSTQPDYDWDSNDNLLLRYSYKFMPKGIIIRLICAMHSYIAETHLVWRNGVILEKSDTRAEIIEDYGKREIRIRISGTHKKDLLTVITYEVDKIHTSFSGLDYEQLIPCNCSTCKNSQSPHFYSYDMIQRRLSRGKRFVECYQSYEDVNILSLIDDIIDIKDQPEDRVIVTIGNVGGRDINVAGSAVDSFKLDELGHLYEAKLLVVGEPGAGKTSLVKKLLDPNYLIPNPQEDSTIGIEINSGWIFPYKRDKEANFVANIWDFGGQQIQYLIHQFFLTPDSLYILVADDREQRTEFDYWFNAIYLFGKGSPVLVILNEKNYESITNFDLDRYQKQFGHKLKIERRDIDLAKDDGRLGVIRNKIQEMLSNLEHTDQEVPKQWISIRQELTQLKPKNHITVDDYFEICERHGLKQELEILEPQKSLQMRQDLRQEKNLGSPFGRRKESRFN